MPLPQEFVPLNRGAFDTRACDCGKADMNTFLVRHAAKHMSQGLSSSWVLPADFPKDDQKTPIAAFYTLAPSTIAKQEVPPQAGLGSMPRYPIPVVLLARLAVSVDLQGQGYGEKVLVSALRHVAKLTEQPEHLPAVALVLDVLDEEAKGFYDKFEMFYEMCDNPMKLFSPISVLRKI